MLINANQHAFGTHPGQSFRKYFRGCRVVVIHHKNPGQSRTIPASRVTDAMVTQYRIKSVFCPETGWMNMDRVVTPK
jgi:hypothetical protein